MRRQDREIRDYSVILDIINSLPVGHLAMNDAGKPYGVTMNYISELVAARNAVLYFHGAKEGRKVEILSRDPHVYFFAERDDGPKVIARPNGTRSVTNLYVSVAGEGVMEPVGAFGEKLRVLPGRSLLADLAFYNNALLLAEIVADQPEIMRIIQNAIDDRRAPYSGLTRTDSGIVQRFTDRGGAVSCGVHLKH